MPSVLDVAARPHRRDPDSGGHTAGHQFSGQPQRDFGARHYRYPPTGRRLGHRTSDDFAQRTCPAWRGVRDDESNRATLALGFDDRTVGVVAVHSCKGAGHGSDCADCLAATVGGAGWLRPVDGLSSPRVVRRSHCVPPGDERTRTTKRTRGRPGRLRRAVHERPRLPELKNGGSPGTLVDAYQTQSICIRPVPPVAKICRRNSSLFSLNRPSYKQLSGDYGRANNCFVRRNMRAVRQCSNAGAIPTGKSH
jgi:hypothetical protein